MNPVRHKRLAAWLLAGLLLVVVRPSIAGSPAPSLQTPNQERLERLALRIFHSPTVQSAMDASRKVYESNPLAHTTAGHKTLDAALASITMAMVQWAVNGDAARPELFWVATAKHQWMGYDFPNTGYGIENPDNIYRHAPIDGHSRYEIRGRVPPNPPAQQSFTLYAALPGTEAMEREGAIIVGALDKVATAADGSFVVTIDREPAAGRKNHIQSAGRTALLIVRDSLTDWQSQSPIPISIDRVEGTQPALPQNKQQMAEQAVALMHKAIPFWEKYNAELIYNRAANTVPAPRRRGGGWGYGLTGHFHLPPEHALIVTLDPKGANYLGFQLADPWGVAREYVYRNGSLNNSQTQPNKDGSISYVIASEDPGAHNWLDTGGIDRGIFAIRWQDVPPSVNASDGMVRNVKLLPLATLRQSLDKDTVWLNAEERAAQLAQRQQGFERRLQKQNVAIDRQEIKTGDEQETKR